MRGAGNVTGGDNVLTWRTGYPFGVNFSRGYPRYNPGEYTAADLLARREVDAALIVASDPAPFFGRAALEHLASIPTVVIDARPTSARQTANVAFATAPFGLQTGGTVYRMDEIPLTLRPALPPIVPVSKTLLSGCRPLSKHGSDRVGTQWLMRRRSEVAHEHLVLQDSRRNRL